MATNPCVSAPPFKAFVFDLDGCLLDTLPDLVVLTNQALAESGFPPRSAAEIKSYVGNGLLALMYQAVPADAPPQAAERAMANWKERHLAHDSRATLPYQGIQETLTLLQSRGIGLSVVSNKFDEGARQIIEAKLPGLFQTVHGESEGFPRKPDPEGLLRALGELGVAPFDAAYVGDSPGDIEVAHRAGCAGIGVSWGYHDAEKLRKCGADYLINRADELLQLAQTD